jgi:hypothetical protein
VAAQLAASQEGLSSVSEEKHKKPQDSNSVEIRTGHPVYRSGVLELQASSSVQLVIRSVKDGLAIFLTQAYMRLLQFGAVFIASRHPFHFTRVLISACWLSFQAAVSYVPQGFR